MIKEKKAAIADADLEIEKRVLEVDALAKEKASLEKAAASLEKQYEWISEERQ